MLRVGNAIYDELVTACLCLHSLAPTNTIQTFFCLIFKKSPLFPGYFRLGQDKTKQTFIHLMDNIENINCSCGVQNYSYLSVTELHNPKRDIQPSSFLI